jgi:Transcriptional regulator, AbiEi antitoxin
MDASVPRPPRRTGRSATVAAVPAIPGSSPGSASSAVPAVRLAVLMRRQAGLFTRAQAMSCGYSTYQIRRRVRSGEWQAVFGPVLAAPGLRLTAALRDVAAILAVQGATLGGPSAARRHGIPVTDPRSYLIAPAGTRVRLPGVRVVRDSVPSRDRVVIDGLPVTALPRTVFDCLRLLPEDDAQRLLAAARRCGWISADELAEQLHRFAGRRGAKRLAHLCRRAPAGCGPPERGPRVVLFETDRVAVELVHKTESGRTATSRPPVPLFTPSDLVDRPTVVLATLRAALGRER